MLDWIEIRKCQKLKSVTYSKMKYFLRLLVRSSWICWGHQRHADLWFQLRLNHPNASNVNMFLHEPLPPPPWQKSGPPSFEATTFGIIWTLNLRGQHILAHKDNDISIYISWWTSTKLDKHGFNGINLIVVVVSVLEEDLKVNLPWMFLKMFSRRSRKFYNCRSR